METSGHASGAARAGQRAGVASAPAPYEPHRPTARCPPSAVRRALLRGLWLNPSPPRTDGAVTIPGHLLGPEIHRCHQPARSSLALLIVATREFQGGPISLGEAQRVTAGPYWLS
jgi:hypothetical protein